MAKTLALNSRGSRIRIGSAISLGFSFRSFSVLAWVRIAAHNTTNQGDNTILGSNNCEFYRCIHLIVRGGCPYMGFYQNDIASSQYLELHTWYHLAFVFNLSEGRQSIYINGKLSATETYHRPLEGDAEVYISEYAGARGLNGSLSQLQILPRALNSGEIENLMFQKTEFLVSMEKVGEIGQWLNLTPAHIVGRITLNYKVPIYENFHWDTFFSQSSFDDDYTRLYNNPQFSDIIITVQVSASMRTSSGETAIISDATEPETSQKNFFAHKVVLTSRSEYFTTMFTSGMIESTAKEVALTDVEPELFSLYLKILYSKNYGNISKILKSQDAEELSIVMKLLQYSERFQSSKLTSILELFLIASIMQSPPSSTTEEKETATDRSDLLKILQSIAEEQNLSRILFFFNDRVSFLKHYCSSLFQPNR